MVVVAAHASTNRVRESRIEGQNAPEREAGQPVTDHRAGHPSCRMMRPNNARPRGQPGNRGQNVERDVRERPRAGDDHGYNSREDGDTQNGSQHATSKYHDGDLVAFAAPGHVLKGRFARLVRILVAVGLTALLLWQSDPGAVWQAARGADWRFILLACALVVSTAR